jgi:hypothetical protein
MNSVAGTSCWSILGIEHTKDQRAIKRAYAVALKTTRPDEDAEKFQALRSAYELALQISVQEDFDEDYEEYEQAEEAAPAGQRVESQPEWRPERQPEAPVETWQHSSQTDTQTYYQAPRPIDVARTAWDGFIKKCESIAPNIDQAGVTIRMAELASFAEVALSDIVKHEDFDSLEVRDLFRREAYSYCVRNDALPIVRVTCLQVLKWEDELKMIGFDDNYQARQAISLAIADRQYDSLLRVTKKNAPVQIILNSHPKDIRWWRFLSEDYRMGIRNCLVEIRNTMREAEYHRIGSEKIDAWIEMAWRPWPTPGAYFAALLFGLVATALTFDYLDNTNLLAVVSQESRRSIELTIRCFIFLSPIALLLLYPVYIFPSYRAWTQKIQAMRKVQLGWWLACGAATVAGMSLKFLPPAFETVFIGLVIFLAVGDLWLRGLLALGYLGFVAMMVVMSANPIFTALTPFMGTSAFFIPALVSALFVAPHAMLLSRYGVDLHATKIRAGLLLAGVLLAAAEYFLAPRVPTFSAILGWTWILAGAAAADLFMMKLASNKGEMTALIWLIGVAGIFYLPKAVELESPVADILRLQMTVGAALVIGLIHNGWLAWKTWREERKGRT